MPTMPELAHGAGEIGTSEVVHQPEAEDTCCADGDERIARKVAVDLEREEQRSYEIAAAIMFVKTAENGIYVCAAAVGKHQFQEIAPDHHAHALHGALVIKRPLPPELRQEVVGALDRARHQLREERDKEGVSQEVTLHPGGAAIDIDGIAQCLKGVKRYAYG